MTAPSTPRAAASPAHYSPGEIDSSSIKYIVPKLKPERSLPQFA